jgi:hypothetical protein
MAGQAEFKAQTLIVRSVQKLADCSYAYSTDRERERGGIAAQLFTGIII